jgi:deazaflavin-dependent oxidoreductase (nitroreductase family)
MSEPTAGTAGAPTRADAPKMPWYIPAFSPLLVRLLRAGVPLGFNGLITIRGRKSGQPRTAGVAIIQREGRRFVWAPFGEVNWVRNLRAAGEATITYRRREERVRATELDPAQRLSFFRDILGPLARSFPGGMTFIRVMDKTDLAKPEEAAQGRVVFELHPRS